MTEGAAGLNKGCQAKPEWLWDPSRQVAMPLSLVAFSSLEQMAPVVFAHPLWAALLNPGEEDSGECFTVSWVGLPCNFNELHK